MPRYPGRRNRKLPSTSIDVIVSRVPNTDEAHRVLAVWLERVHQLRINAGTIQRAFCDLELPVLTMTPRRLPFTGFTKERMVAVMREADQRSVPEVTKKCRVSCADDLSLAETLRQFGGGGREM